MNNCKLYNEIVYVIESGIKLKTSVIDSNIQGFMRTDSTNSKKDLVFREYINGKIYIFETLLNSNCYKRKDALDILGPCFLTTALDYEKIKDMNFKEIKQKDIKEFSKFITPIWLSDSSKYFILAKNMQEQGK